MPQYKVSFIFNQNRFGWSETWYLNVSNIPAAKTAGQKLAMARAKILGRQSILEAFRVTDVEQPRICGLVVLDALGTAEYDTDTPWNGVLVSVCAQDLYHRSFILRGLPDVFIHWDNIENRMTITGEGVTAFKPMRDALKGQPWQLRVISKDPADVGQGFNGPLAAGDGGNTTFAYIHPALSAGDTVRISGYVGPDAKMLNGVHKVLKNTGAAITIDLPFATLTDAAANLGGKTGRRKITYIAVTDATVLWPRKKSTGRAFFVPLGRRRRAL